MQDQKTNLTKKGERKENGTSDFDYRMTFVQYLVFNNLIKISPYPITFGEMPYETYPPQEKKPYDILRRKNQPYL